MQQEKKPNIPNDVVIQCPLIRFNRQAARVCGCVNDDLASFMRAQGAVMVIGKPCMHFRGFIDHGDELVASIQEQQKAMNQVPEERLAILLKAPFEKRFQLSCGHPMERRMEKIFGMEE